MGGSTRDRLSPNQLNFNSIGSHSVKALPLSAVTDYSPVTGFPLEPERPRGVPRASARHLAES
jgi:hypothetical protein